MRLYLKLFLIVAIFVCAANSRTRRAASDLTFSARVGYVYRFGSAADHEALNDDADHLVARESGNLHLYEAGKRYHALLAERRAAAARRNTTLTEGEVSRIATEVFRGSNAVSAMRRDGPNALPPPRSPVTNAARASTEPDVPAHWANFPE